MTGGMKQAVERICHLEGIPYAAVFGPRRHRPVVNVRVAVAYFLRENKGWSLGKIGIALNRHRTTIPNMLRRAETAMACPHRDEQLAKTIWKAWELLLTA